MELLATIDLIPEQLHADVYKAIFSERKGEVSGWVFVSRGLAKVGQRELAFSLKREPYEREDDIPAVPLQWLVFVHRLASEGRLVERGGLTELHSPGLFPDDDVKGVIYDRIQRVENFRATDIEPDTLAVIPLLSEEIKALKWCGPARILALLGKHYRYYPYPQWYDRRRPSVIDLAAHECHSILTRVESIYVPYVDIYYSGSTVVLRLSQDRAGDLHESLATVPHGQAFALLASPSSFVDAALVWQPGQGAREVILPEGIVHDFRGDRRVGGSFLIVVPGVSERAVVMLEDGFGVVMSEREWADFRIALKNVDSFTFRGEGSIGHEFVIQWYQPRYASPFGDVFYAPGGFQTYTPRVQYDDEISVRYDEEINDKAVELERILLLQSQEETGERVSVKELTDFIRLVELTVDDHFTARITQSEELLLEFNLAPGQGVELHIAACPDFDEELMYQLYARLGAIPLPEVSIDPVRFQLHVRLLKDHINGSH